MAKKPIILGIETSCDETAVSIIQDDGSGIPKILSNIVSSQFDVHKEFGGVVPELAARSHVEKIDLITKKAIEESGISLDKVSAIAVTAGLTFWFVIITSTIGYFSYEYLIIFSISILAITQIFAYKVSKGLDKFAIFNTTVFLGLLFIFIFRIQY